MTNSFTKKKPHSSKKLEWRPCTVFKRIARTENVKIETGSFGEMSKISKIVQYRKNCKDPLVLIRFRECGNYHENLKKKMLKPPWASCVQFTTWEKICEKDDNSIRRRCKSEN